MVLLPFFDIPSGFQLGKITEECPFQGPVFFDLVYKEVYLTWMKIVETIPAMYYIFILIKVFNNFAFKFIGFWN